MEDAAYSSNYGNMPFGGGYDPAQRYAAAEAKVAEKETQIIQEVAAKEAISAPFGALTLGPHTQKLIAGIVGDMVFSGWDDFNKWLADNEAIFTGEAGAEMRSIFIHGFNTGNEMRKDDEARNGKTTFTLVS